MQSTFGSGSRPVSRWIAIALRTDFHVEYGMHADEDDFEEEVGAASDDIMKEKDLTVRARLHLDDTMKSLSSIHSKQLARVFLHLLLCWAACLEPSR